MLDIPLCLLSSVLQCPTLISFSPVQCTINTGRFSVNIEYCFGVFILNILGYY